MAKRAKRRAKTPTEVLCGSLPASTVAEMEAFRVEFEKSTGEVTNLSRLYSTQLPPGDRRRLIQTDPQAYIAAMPAYVAAFHRRQLSEMAKRGAIELAPAEMVRLYVAGLREPNALDPSRRVRLFGC